MVVVSKPSYNQSYSRESYTVGWVEREKRSSPAEGCGRVDEDLLELITITSEREGKEYARDA
jgi:hypothetical protein